MAADNNIEAKDRPCLVAAEAAVNAIPCQELHEPVFCIFDCQALPFGNWAGKEFAFNTDGSPPKTQQVPISLSPLCLSLSVFSHSWLTLIFRHTDG